VVDGGGLENEADRLRSGHILLRFSGDVAKGLPTSSGSSILSAPRQSDVRAGRAVNFTPGTGAFAGCYLSLTRSGGRFGLG